MGDLIRAPKVHVVTKDGQCDIHITLDLNINVNGLAGTKPVDKIEDSEEKTDWVIPTFKPAEKVKFGKKETKET